MRSITLESWKIVWNSFKTATSGARDCLMAILRNRMLNTVVSRPCAQLEVPTWNTIANDSFTQSADGGGPNTLSIFEFGVFYRSAGMLLELPPEWLTR